MTALHLNVRTSGDTGCGAFPVILVCRSSENVRNWLVDDFYFAIVLGGLTAYIILEYIDTRF